MAILVKFSRDVALESKMTVYFSAIQLRYHCWAAFHLSGTSLVVGISEILIDNHSNLINWMTTKFCICHYSTLVAFAKFHHD